MPVNLFKLSGEVDVNTGKAEANLKRIERDAKRTQTVLGQTETSGKRAGSGIASGFNQGTSSAGRLLREISQLHSKLGSLKAPSLNFGSAGGSGGMLGGIKSIVGGNLISGAISSALSGITDGLKEGWSAGIEYNKMLEKANISFTTLLGSTAKAQEHLKALQAFGEATPFEFPDLIKASQRMQAMGFTAKDIIPTLKNIGDAVSAIGGGKDELDGVVLALGQMQTKGKVSAEEMNQLAERGIPAWDLLAQAIGKTKAETIKLSEAGRLNGGRAVQGITAMMGERFGGQMDKMSGTLEGRESNLNDILNRRLGEATKGNTAQLSDAMAKGAAGLTTVAGEDFAKKLDQKLTKIGADFAPMMQKFASGEYFMQGISSIDFGEKAVKSFNEGDAKGLITNGAQALGMKTGAAGTEQTADAIASSLKQKAIFSTEFDAKLISWVTGALQKTGEAAKAGAKLVGIGTGEGIITGTKDSLDSHSPSKKMIEEGFNASIGFVIGFEAGKKGIKPITAEDLYKKQADKAEKAGYDDAFKKSGKKYGIKPELLAAIASRESGMRNITGDNGNGLSVMQIDKRAHPEFARSDAWKNNPDMAIDKGASVLAGNIKWLKNMAGKQTSVTSSAGQTYKFTVPKLDEKLLMQTAVAMYNSGGFAAYHVSKGRSPDYGTTGKDYSADVLNRAGYFEKFMGSIADAPSLYERAAAAYDAASASVSSFTDQALRFIGLGATTPALVTKAPATPKAPAIQQAQAPQTVQGGQLATSTTTAKADILTLSKDAASATVQLSVPLKEITPTATTATEALKSTASQAGMFADAITETGKAAGEAIDHLSHFKDAFASGFDNMFDDILDGKKVSMKDFGKQLFKGGLSSIISSATGGQASSPGGMLSNMLFGGKGGGNGGSGGGGSFPSTGGFAGGGGAGDILGKAQGIGSMFQKGGMLSKLPGLGKVGGLLGKIPGLSKLGSLFGMGSVGAAAGAGGAAGAAGGASGASGLLAAAGGPIGMAIALGATVAMPLLSKLFAKDPLKDYKKHIKAEYGIDASKQILQKVFEIGQSKFGKDAPKRQIETVRLPEVRDMLSEYSGAFMKGGNAKLFNSAEYGDQFSAVNQFKVGMRANGGPVMAGQPYIVGERRAELFMPNSNGRIMPSVDGHGGGGWMGKAREEYTRLQDTMDSTAALIQMLTARIQSMPADHVVMTGLHSNPDLAMNAVDKSAGNRSEASRKFREKMGAR